MNPPSLLGLQSCGQYCPENVCQEADIEKDKREAAEKERDEYVKKNSDLAHELGVLQGMYNAAHWPGVVEGWKERAEKAESTLAERDTEIAELRKRLGER